MPQNGSAPTPTPTAIVVRNQEISPYEPISYEQALLMADTFAKSQLCKVGTAPAAYLVMATGKSLGIPPETALRTFHVIEGTVTLPAQIMVAICLRHREVCEYFDCVEVTAKSATYETKRVGRPAQQETYTLEQAQRAHLIRDGGNWQKDPQSMLIARASSRLARRAFPDLLAGLHTPEEIMGIEHDVVETTSTMTAPAVTAEPVVVPDAETQPDADAEQEAAFAAALRSAPDEAAAQVIGAEIHAVWTDKKAPARQRLLTIWKEAKKRGWNPPAATEREPGADG